MNTSIFLSFAITIIPSTRRHDSNLARMIPHRYSGISDRGTPWPCNGGGGGGAQGASSTEQKEDPEKAEREEAARKQAETLLVLHTEFMTEDHDRPHPEIEQFRGKSVGPWGKFVGTGAIVPGCMKYSRLHIPEMSCC
jgi:hypothetical protein